MTIGFKGGQYRPLTESGVKDIHEMTVRIIGEVGIKVPNKQALDIFEEKGAEVDRDIERVKISRTMLEEILAATPSQVILCGREEKYDLTLEGSRTHLGTGGTVLHVLDLETGKRRLSIQKDIECFAKMVDALENIHFYVINVYPNDKPLEQVDVFRFFGALSNTTKHVMGGIYTMEGLRNVIKMAEEIAGGAEALRRRPFISMITCVMSPLMLDENYTDFLIEVARQGIPLVTPAEPLAGATSPVTIAGTIATCNIETLSGVILAQLVNPGTPVMYGTVATAMDMKSGSYLSGNIEMGLINAGCAQMAQFYEIPMYATAGMSDSKMPDCQAGYEKASTAMITALAGANYIHDAAGLLEFCTTASYEQMVIDDEIIGICLRAVRGVEVNKETLAEDVVRKVGPAGNFLSEGHTVQNFRREFFFPKVGDRQSRKLWESAGAKDTATRAREMAQEILQKHHSKGIDAAIIEDIAKAHPYIKS